jgi:Ca-activated chloride channel family protein
VFAGRAYVVSPLTTDHGALQLYVDAVDPEMVSQGGSSIGMAINQAVDLARGPSGRSRAAAVVLMSDGESTEDEEDAVVQATQRARRLGISVHTFGLGTSRGERIPESDPRTGSVAGFKRDPFGNVVVSQLNERVLRNVADETGGSYFNADQPGSTGALLQTLKDLDRTRGDQATRVERQDRTGWFIALALLLLALDHVWARRSERKRKPASGQWPGVRAQPAARRVAAAILLLVLLGWGIGALERGNRHYRAGRYAEAVREYEAALRDNVNTPELHYNLGTALLQLGRFQDAQQHLQRALLAPDPGLRQRTYFNEGYRTLIPGRRGGSDADQQLDAAIESYKHALRLDPRDQDAKWNLELALRKKEEQQQSPQASQSQQQGGSQEDEQNPARGGGAGSSPAQSSAGQGRSQGSRMQQRPMSREQADRILSAIEQDERDLTRQKLRKGQRSTPVARDW